MEDENIGVPKFISETQMDKMNNGENRCQKQLALFGQTVIQTEGVESIKDRIIRIVSRGIQDDLDCEIMGNSLFYYCCGKDPTPITAFGGSFPLYVYVDILYSGDFRSEIDELYHRLTFSGFKAAESYNIDASRLKGYKSECRNLSVKSELTVWKTQDGGTFFLLYVKGNPEDTLYELYRHPQQGPILPKCICNILYEDNHDQVFRVEKRTEYILGHCHDNKYRKIAELEYLGDYGWEKVDLWHRRFYFVW